jgi:type II secretion system protein J
VTRPSHARRAPARAAFTLLEVMLTVAITATVFAMLGTILFSTIQASEQIERKLRTEKAGYGVLTTLRRDLTGCYAYALGGPAFKGADKQAGNRKADELRFVTTARILPATDDQPAPTLAEVGYVLQDSEDTTRGLTLFRRAAPFEGDPLQGSGDFVEIYTGVESLELTYLDPEDKDWKESWDEPDTLPLAVKVELELTVTAEERAAAEAEQVELPSPKFSMIVGLAARAAPKADPAPAPAPTPGN